MDHKFTEGFSLVDFTMKALEHLAPVCYFPVLFFKTACCPLILLRHLHQPTSFILRSPCRIQGHVDKIKIEVMWLKLFFTTSPKIHRLVFRQTLGSDFQNLICLVNFIFPFHGLPHKDRKTQVAYILCYN